MSYINDVAREINEKLSTRVAASDRDVEWQRVNSLIADVLKDAHVLYAKLARLQGDFAGGELNDLEKISEGVLSIGGKLSSFSKAFYEGRVTMTEADVYGEEDRPLFGGSEAPSSPAPEMSDLAPVTSPDEEGSAEVEVEFDYSPDDEESSKEGSESAE